MDYRELVALVVINVWLKQKWINKYMTQLYATHTHIHTHTLPLLLSELIGSGSSLRILLDKAWDEAAAAWLDEEGKGTAPRGDKTDR